MAGEYVRGRFRVAAASRHPRLGVDYDPIRHKYTDSYLHPRGYGINVDTFPGKKLTKPRGDQQLPQGADTHDVKDIWELLCPKDLMGWVYSITGTPDVPDEVVGVPRPAGKFEASGSKLLGNHEGQFHEERQNNPWNWRFEVPALGTYTVTVSEIFAAPDGGTVLGKTQSRTLRLRDFLVVSIGDSAASGQGNPDVPGKPADYDADISWWEYFLPYVVYYKASWETLKWAWNQLKLRLPVGAAALDWSIDMDPAPIWLEPRAERSLRSGPAWGAKMLEDLEKGIMVTCLLYGRTDSQIQSGLIGPRDDDGWVNNDGQIVEVLRTIGDRRIDALIISIGINDVGVTSSLEGLLSGDNRYWAKLAETSDENARQEVAAEDRQNIAEIPDSFQLLEAALGALNVRNVYLTEYPEALFDDSNGEPSEGCEMFSSDFDMDITTSDAALLKDIAHELNVALKAEADLRGRLGWFYIGGIADGFRGHGYCVGRYERGSYFVQASESLALQGNMHGACHPNQYGATVIASRISAEVRKHTLVPLIAGPVVAPVTPGGD